jgi:hypothetical protein
MKLAVAHVDKLSKSKQIVFVCKIKIKIYVREIKIAIKIFFYAFEG